MEEKCVGNTGSIDFLHERTDLTGHVHHLPCCIKHTGPSEVSHYFKPISAEIEIDDLAIEEASFRGRKLMGATLSMPQGYSGFVLGKKDTQEDKSTNKSRKEKAPSECEGSMNDWVVLAKSRNITVWNHDNVPSKDDAFLRSFHWLTVAKALHKPVTPEEMESQTLKASG